MDNVSSAQVPTGSYATRCMRARILYMIGMPLLLGSWLGLLVLPLILGALSVRIFIEEDALREGLPSYGEYTARVRYRLIPGVW